MVLEKKNRRNYGSNTVTENTNKNINLNENIPFSKLQVISNDGENLGVLLRDVAVSLAESEGLDLVVVSENGSDGVPVAKIMNYSKKLYEEKKKLHNNKKKSGESQNKEIRISLKIGENDLKIKMNQCLRLLIEGCRVKVVLVMRGREKSLKDTLGVQTIERAFLMLEKMYQEKNLPKNLVYDQEKEGNDLLVRIFYLKK